MQELVKINNREFLSVLAKNGFKVYEVASKKTEFPICVDFNLKTAFRLTSVTCLAGFAMAKKKTISQEEFLNKYSYIIQNEKDKGESK